MGAEIMSTNSSQRRTPLFEICVCYIFILAMCVSSRYVALECSWECM